MTARAVPDRNRWAVAQLGLRPEDRVLEFGCGPGAAAELVCDRLGEGTMLAVDRSATAVARTAARNHVHVGTAGRPCWRPCGRRRPPTASPTPECSPGTAATGVLAHRSTEESP
jgi:hypothetical protein